MGIKKIIKNNISGIQSSINRFPITIIYAITLCILLILDLEIKSINKEIIEVVLLGMVLSLALGLFIEVLEEKHKKTGYLLYILEIVSLYFLHNYLVKASGFIVNYRYIGLSLISILMVGFIGKILNNEDYEFYVIDIIKSFVIAMMNSIVLLLGLYFIVFTISTLFNIDINYRIYSYLYFIISTIFFMPLFISRFPQNNKEYTNYKISDVIEKLFSYILIPLIIIYTVILYAFFIKILVTRDWPEGIVSHLVLWYSMVGVFVLFFSKSISKENKIADSFRKYYPILNLVNLGLMFYAIYIRISLYGFTMNRYYVLMGGIWVLLMDLFYIKFKSEKNIVVPISIAVAIIMSLFGPLNSFNVSLRSQANRLEKIFIENNLIIDNKLNKVENLDENKIEEITSILNYIDYNFGIEKIKFLPQDIKIEEIENILDIKLGQGYNPVDRNEYISYERQNKYYDINGYSIMFKPNFWREDIIEIEELNIKVNSDYELELIENENSEKLNLVKDLNEKVNLKEIKEDDKIFFDTELNNRNIRIYVDNLYGNYNKNRENSKVNITNLEVTILVK